MTVARVCPVATRAAGHDGESVDDLRQRIAELTEAVAARDAFIAAAGHDLRNAITPIMGQVDLLVSSFMAGRCALHQVEPRLERVQHAMIRFLKRAKVLLDVSRLTGGKLRLDLETFDLALLLRDAAGDVRAVPRLGGARIRVAAPATLMVTLDLAAMEQVISNLIYHALRHDADAQVDVSAAVIGQQVRIEVGDHGSDPSRLSGRSGRATRESDPNDDVGLWIAGQFVAAMEGTVTARNAPGRGTLLTVTLPLALRDPPR